MWFLQLCFSFSELFRLFSIPCNFRISFFVSVKFSGYYFGLCWILISLGKNWHLQVLSLAIHEHSLAFWLLRSLISLSVLYKLSLTVFHVYISLNFSSDILCFLMVFHLNLQSLLVYRNTVDFCMLTLFCVALINLIILI